MSMRVQGLLCEGVLTLFRQLIALQLRLLIRLVPLVESSAQPPRIPLP